MSKEINFRPIHGDGMNNIRPVYMPLSEGVTNDGGLCVSYAIFDPKFGMKCLVVKETFCPEGCPVGYSEELFNPFI